MTDEDHAKAQLELDEGRVRWVYKDSLGYYTIGIGCLVDQRKGGGLQDIEIDFIFNNRFAQKKAELLKRIPWAAKLDVVRLYALVNMCFQMGVDGLLGFPLMLQSLQASNYSAAYQDCLESKWHTQTPERCARVAKQLLTGEWE